MPCWRSYHHSATAFIFKLRVVSVNAQQVLHLHRQVLLAGVLAQLQLLLELAELDVDAGLVAVVLLVLGCGLSQAHCQLLYGVLFVVEDPRQLFYF